MDSSWIADANCRGMDPALFFPQRTSSSAEIATILKVCEGCTVQAECLAWALHLNERDGIWGSTTGRQRRTIRGEQIRSGGYPARCIECGAEFLTASHGQLCSDECRDTRRRKMIRRSKQARRGAA